MKKQIKILAITMITSIGLPLTSQAQSIADCIEQLALDYQKLAGLKSVLTQMYTGYEVLSKGYNSVKSVSQGNFTLQEAFLDGLYVVSPTVRKYPRVADILSNQGHLVSEYKSASGRNRQAGAFSPDELSYMAGIYDHLISASLKNLDDLAMVMGDNKLRMSDAERLTIIDRIYAESRDQLSYLRKFNGQAERMALQRQQAAVDQNNVKGLYGIKN